MTDDSIWNKIAMEYCGGGSCSDLLDILEEGCNEAAIRYIISEALKVRQHELKMIRLNMSKSVLNSAKFRFDF